MAATKLGTVDKALFFTSVNGDRPYTATDFVAYLGSAIGNGIIDRDSTGGTSGGPFGASVSGFQITIGSGSAVIGGDYGHFARQLDPKIINLTPATTNPRWDRVVLVVDNTVGVRTIEFGVITGSESASYTPGTNPFTSSSQNLVQNSLENGSVYEFLLFDVYVPTSGTVSINYDYTKFVDYEVKESKVSTVSDINSNSTSVVKFPTVKGLYDWALPKSAGSSHPLTGSLYVGGQSVYDLKNMYSQADQSIVIYGTGALSPSTTKRISLQPYSATEPTFYTHYLGVYANKLFTAQNGLLVNGDQGAYGLRVAVGETWLETPVTISAAVDLNGNLDMNSNKLSNAKTDKNWVGTAPNSVWSNGNGESVLGISSDANGKTLTLSDTTGALYLVVTFGINVYQGNPQFYTPYGLQTTTFKMSSLSENGTEDHILHGKFVQSGNIREIFAKVNLNGTSLQIYDPKALWFTDSTGVKSMQVVEDTIYIYDVTVIYGEVYG